MITAFVRKFTFTCLLAIMTASCGGGGGGGVASGGIGGTGISSGTVTGFGSIFVNGVEFDTTGATITIEDQPGSENQLVVGQVVTVRGTFNADGITGTATSVVFRDNVEGPVDSINLANNTLVVLGQTVRVDASTSFDNDINPQSLAGLNPGDFVEVSGFVKANGGIVATRIELKAPGGELEVKGLVSGLDTLSSLFNINALTVDFSGAVLENFPGAGPSNGDVVEVKCDPLVAPGGNCFDAGGVLLATRVELLDPALGAAEDDEVEIEGFITRFVDEFDFDVAGQPVTTNAQTVFENGTAADLALNVKVEVEGRVDANGVLVADEVDIRRPNNIKIEARVQGISNSTVTLLGIPVTVDELTRLEDQSAADLKPFGLADIDVGDFLEVRGSEDPPGSGSVLASRLERDDFEPEVLLQGFVESVSQPDFVILGVTIETDATTQFEDQNDNIITSAEFFARVAAGELVKAKGTHTGSNRILAVEVEFEDED